MRRYDCAHYLECLTAAARADMPGLQCCACSRYRRELLDSQEVLELLLLALVIAEAPGYEKIIDKA